MIIVTKLHIYCFGDLSTLLLFSFSSYYRTLIIPKVFNYCIGLSEELSEKKKKKKKKKKNYRREKNKEEYLCQSLKDLSNCLKKRGRKENVKNQMKP
jgi:hypothetical protein